MNLAKCAFCGYPGVLLAVHIVDRELTTRSRQVKQATLKACGACFTTFDGALSKVEPSKLRADPRPAKPAGGDGRADVDAFLEDCVGVFAQFTNRGGKKGGLAVRMGDRAVALRDRLKGKAGR